MGGNRHVGAMVIQEDVVQHRLGSRILIGTRLSVQFGPVRVLLREARLKLESREVFMDIRLVAAAIARMRTNTLTEKLFDGGHEWILARKMQV